MRIVLITLLVVRSALIATAQQSTSQLPSQPLKFGVFVARFDPGGTFTLQGDRWPAMNGNWKLEGSQIELSMSGGPGGCDGAGRYRIRTEGTHVGFDLVSDNCVVRRMILDRSN